MLYLKRFKLWIVIALATIAVVGSYFSFKAYERDWYRQKIPPEILTGDAVLIDGESGFREGCGVAIFKLADETKSKIAAHGMIALDSESSHGQSAWTQTPYIITGDGLTLEDRWMAGTGCARMDVELSKTLSDALVKPGAFVKKLHESAVIVIPTAGIVALVYVG